MEETKIQKRTPVAGNEINSQMSNAATAVGHKFKGWAPTPFSFKKLKAPVAGDGSGSSSSEACKRQSLPSHASESSSCLAFDHDDNEQN